MSSVDPVIRLLADLDRPARPSAEFQDALLARLLGQLEDAIHPEPEAQATERSNGPGARLLRAVRTRPGRTLLAFAALTGAAAAALFVSSPWKGSPGFLEQVQAALTPPPGSILHEKFNGTVTSMRFGCTVTSPAEFWIDQRPPHTFRGFVERVSSPESARLHPRAAFCSRARATQSEVGGRVGRPPTLRFVPPNRLSASGFLLVDSADPVRELREAISAGRAHDEGTTNLHGRAVRRIRFDPPSTSESPGCPPTGPTSAFVDPKTFYPVELHHLGCIVLPGEPAMRQRGVTRFLTFEYLPRTAANLALTDIRAQHPDAIGP